MEPYSHITNHYRIVDLDQIDSIRSWVMASPLNQSSLMDLGRDLWVVLVWDQQGGVAKSPEFLELFGEHVEPYTTE